MRRGADSAPLVGRDVQLDATRQMLAIGSQRPAALLLRGEAGIGKTALWRHGLARARYEQRTLLVARPAAEERAVACSGLVDLLRGAPGLANDVLALSSPPDTSPDRPLRRGRALLDEVRRLAAERPVVIAVDDTPWLDDASAQALRYTLRRLETEPVTVLATSRSADVERLDLATTMPAHPLRVLHLEPLSAAALREVLTAHVDRVSQPNLYRLHVLSGGNPLHAIELARCLRALPDGQQVIVLPSSLRQVLERRVADADADLRALIEILAVGGPQSADVLGQVLGGPVTAIVDRGRDTGLLVVDEHERTHFAHPLLAAAADARVTAGDRRALHARLAAVVPDPEDRVRHRALSIDDPDPGIATDLEAAAGRARQRGAGATAAALSEQAVRLTGPADPHRTRRVLQLVDHLAAAGEVERAVTVVDEVAATLPPGPRRAEALLRRFFVDGEDYATGAAVLTRALAESGDDREVRASVLDLLGWVRGMFCGDLAGGLAASREALRLCDGQASRSARHVLTRGHLTHMERLAGLAGPGAMAAVVARAEAHGIPLLGGCPRAWLAKQLLWDGEVDGSRRLVTALLAEGTRTGHELERPYRLYDVALVELTAGRLPEAGQALGAGFLAAADAGNPDAEGWLYYPRAWWHALAGRADEARRCAGRLLSETGRPAGLPAQARARRVLGTLALAEGNPAVAARELRCGAALLRRWGVAHPGAVPVLPDAIEASAGVGELAAAGRLLAGLEGQVERTGTAWGTAMLRRSRAVVALASGGADTAAEELLSVARSLDELGHQIEAARARLLAGQAMLRAGRRNSAAEVLTEAYEAFAELGAVLWQDRARVEAERAATGRTTGSLTPTEREVVRLVVAGRRNREIAAEMFLSVATVEAHLTRTYRKLGIRSRSELAGLVGRGDLDGDLVLAG